MPSWLAAKSIKQNIWYLQSNNNPIRHLNAIKFEKAKNSIALSRMYGSYLAHVAPWVHSGEHQQHTSACFTTRVYKDNLNPDDMIWSPLLVWAGCYDVKFHLWEFLWCGILSWYLLYVIKPKESFISIQSILRINGILNPEWPLPWN